jgi:hypothetical protein
LCVFGAVVAVAQVALLVLRQFSSTVALAAGVALILKSISTQPFLTQPLR